MLSNYSLSAEFRTWFADALYQLASRLFANDQWYQSGLWVVRAQQIDPWVMSTHSPFVDEQTVTAEMLDFTKPFTGVNRDFFGDNQHTYTKAFNQLLLLKSQKVMTDLTQNSREVQLSKENDNVEVRAKYDDFLSSQGSDMKTVAALFLKLLPTEAERFPYVIDDVAGACLMVADYSSRHDTNQIADLYGLALRVKPWVMNGRKWWFEQSTITDEDYPDLEQFVAGWH